MFFSLLISLFLFSTHSPMLTSYDEALSMAEKQDKHILMIFAGSDWCRPCKRLKASILEQPEFQEWADHELILLYLDFPAKKKNKLSDDLREQNEALAEKFNRSGLFPHLVIIDKNEQIIKTIDFHDQSVKDFIADCR